ncbi:alpha/beta fold hydrolase [Mycolicibacterium peregrinum]|uniref:alpha/beta fold hydrolase n=1 Tax=Mycolicibacterium peregrinum TaxID=43304 RepID=UPI003AAC357B
MTAATWQPQPIESYHDHVITANDGVKLHCREYGNPAAELTVVLMHGLCLDLGSWQLQIDELLTQRGPDIRIIGFDYRGHGKSDAAPVKTYTIEQIAADLASVIRALNVTGKVVLAGHSMGGMAALAFLGLPNHLRPVDPVGLVLAASSAGGLAEHGLGRLLATPALSLLADVVATLPDHAAQSAIGAVLGPTCRALARAARFTSAEVTSLTTTAATAFTHTRPAAAIGFLPSLRRYNQLALLGTITATTVIVSGGKDVLTPQHHSEVLAAAIPNAIHLNRPEAGHMVLAQANKTVAEAINTAVGSTRARAAKDA